MAPRSKQEIYLAFELLLFLDYAIDDHKETLAGRIYDCDIIIRQHRLVVEFDGSYYHRGKERTDIDKTFALQKAGWTVIRVREKPLRTLSPMDISVAANSNMKPAADAVLVKIRDELNIPLDGLEDYLKSSNVQNNKSSQAFIRKAMKAKSQ